METRIQKITSSAHNLSIHVIPGHFATVHAHVNYYLDMTGIKNYHQTAKKAAEALSYHFLSQPVETILCLDGTEEICAYLAEKISGCGLNGFNRDLSICIFTPEISSSGQLLLRDNMKSMFKNRYILIMAASITTGQTVRQALEYIQYYNGHTSGIAAIFSNLEDIDGIPVNSIFQTEDFPDYRVYEISDCPFCKSGIKIEALINRFGYSKL